VDGEEFEASATDALAGQEVIETAYHELWELVHVFFEHEGLLQPRCEGEVCVTCGDVAVPASVVHIEGMNALVRTAQGDEAADLSLVGPVRPGDLVLVHGGVALEKLPEIDAFSRDFYPFLSGETVDVPGVLADVSASILSKWEEVASLRRAVDWERVTQAAHAVGERVVAGGRVLAFGNGGSATDSADLAGDLLSIGVPAVDLAGEPAIVTALGNDIGFAEIFARQLIALGRPGDVAVGVSTSGRSGNVLRALEQARSQGMMTVALAGYGGGDLVGQDAVDHLLAVDSTYIPRIQEVQATQYHALVRQLEVMR
jgi:D-sedoheptulose 7-phosphate isomerase